MPNRVPFRACSRRAGRFPSICRASYGPRATTPRSGFDVPYFIETIARHRRQFGRQVLEEQPRRRRHCSSTASSNSHAGGALRAGALGLELSVPTGNRREVLRYRRSSASTRSSPRATSAVARAGEIHVGYQIYTGDELTDVLNWSVEVYARGSEHYALARRDFTGRYFDDFGRHGSTMSCIMPGLDFNLTDNFIDPTHRLDERHRRRDRLGHRARYRRSLCESRYALGDAFQYLDLDAGTGRAAGAVAPARVRSRAASRAAKSSRPAAAAPPRPASRRCSAPCGAETRSPRSR